MNLDDKLATAFAAWSDARAQLGKLRAQSASGPGGRQLAPSPEAVAHFDAMREQESVCMRLWLELATVAEERAAALELTQASEMRTRAETSLRNSLRVQPPVPPEPPDQPDRKPS